MLELSSARRAAAGVLVVVLAGVLGCGQANQPSPAPFAGNDDDRRPVSGKVTYNGAAVAAGYLVFYNPELGLNKETGQFRPIGFAEIHQGNYSAMLPVGVTSVCVMTDPDVDVFALLFPPPTATGPGGPGDPMMPQPPPGIPLPPMPPGVDGPMPPMPGGSKDVPARTASKSPPSPFLARMTEAQKATLKEIHAKHGTFGKSRILLKVDEKQPLQNITLK